MSAAGRQQTATRHPPTNCHPSPATSGGSLLVCALVPLVQLDVRCLVVLPNSQWEMGKRSQAPRYLQCQFHAFPQLPTMRLLHSDSYEVQLCLWRLVVPPNSQWEMVRWVSAARRLDSLLDGFVSRFMLVQLVKAKRCLVVLPNSQWEMGKRSQAPI